MVSIKELLRFGNRAKESGNFFRYLQGAGGEHMDAKFARDIFTGVQRDVHDEFVACKEAYRENSLVHASVETMVDLILGDALQYDSDNLVLKKFIEDHWFHDSGFAEALKIAVKEAIITGNGYIEVGLDNKGNPTKFFPFANSEDIYVDYDYGKGKVIKYVQRIEGINEGDQIAPLKNVTIHNLPTPYGFESVRGIEIPKENLIHLKFNYSAWNVYGRSDIAAVLDDIRILKTIERSMAVISRYKAIPKRVLMVNTREGEKPLSPDEMTKLSDTLKTQTDFENPLLNRELQSLDLSSGGAEVNLVPYIDYLKRNITVNMAPEFLIHGQEVNRATSREQKQTYFLRIASKRSPWELQISNLIKQCVANIKNPALEGEGEFKFGEFDVELPEEKEATTVNRFTSGVITLAEAREALDLPEIEGTDLFNWEITQPQGLALPGEEIESVSIKRKANKAKKEKKK